jgi:uncharacterized protein
MRAPSLPVSLYVGHTSHSRLKPRPHQFTYGVFQLLIDIDRVDEATSGLACLSKGRFGLFSFAERDHGARDGSSLRTWVEQRLTDASIPASATTIRLLCFPRVLGFVFNPLSIFFVHGAGERLEAVIYEVNNTFGQSHAYVFAATGDAEQRQTADKQLYVSPFYRVEGGYQFKLTAPDERFRLVIAKQVDGEIDFTANLIAERRDLTDAALLKLFFGMPLMTLGVVAAIHWEALRLWIKGAPFGARPPGPKFGFSVGRAISRLSWNDTRAMSGKGSKHEQHGRAEHDRRPGARVA